MTESVNMAAHRVACLGLNALYSTVCAPKQALRSCWGAVEQVRSYYVDWRMLRDVKRRQMAFDYANERLRINALRKNTILPKELQEVADKEIAALPRDSCPVRIRNRCVMTSRPRGVKRRWRLSRIVFRHLADHNQMSGILRARW
ncbi:28S ribosomal protein S14, mitochondrial [Pungitius pungitius]|uniref:28S ribosomal protein S14, mitochondrial n=1 Tax=Pungitius pungitius TaxID=134920 RepID=UPI001886C2AC|nr:28S ribosomal protein S14, mitochondrial [Pungitius pungitius]